MGSVLISCFIDCLDIVVIDLGWSSKDDILMVCCMLTDCFLMQMR